ncbi:MAG: hypothetical protein FWH37_09210 [Candidatus Bathyarchaeota archaeon]|nr:hypothetical protein [Candidatus Termiticorpusculum sp.]
MAVVDALLDLRRRRDDCLLCSCVCSCLSYILATGILPNATGIFVVAVGESIIWVVIVRRVRLVGVF